MLKSLQQLLWKNFKMIPFFKEKCMKWEIIIPVLFLREINQKLYVHMKLFCPSPSQRETLINPFSEKDIKSSSNPQAAVHIKSRIILHVHNYKKHYFLLKQIVLQKVWMLQVQRCFAFPSFNLSLIWYTCRCITIIFFLPIFLFQRGKLRNSSTILFF